ncbi:MAG: hypothetical protein HQK60_11240 [Deltaproteobacteria bacterium]|nr:hypothetical protein [Deltaproteobacteria bacterium]
METLATKRDIEDLKHNLLVTESRLQNNIDMKISGVETKISTSQAELIKWTATLIAAQTAIVGVMITAAVTILFKLIH